MTLADKPPIELTLEERLPNMLIAEGRFGRLILSRLGPATCKFKESMTHPTSRKFTYMLKTYNEQRGFYTIRYLIF